MLMATTTWRSAGDGGVAAVVLKQVPSYDEKPDLKLGVLLLQLGGPERADDVEGFLYNLFADPGGWAVLLHDWRGWSRARLKSRRRVLSEAASAG